MSALSSGQRITADPLTRLHRRHACVTWMVCGLLVMTFGLLVWELVLSLLIWERLP